MAILNNVNYVKFLRGTPSAFQKLTNKDANTLYFISETDGKYGSLYLGDKLIAGGTESELISLDMLKDVTISATGLAQDSVLVYDEIQKSWVNKTLTEVLSKVVSEMEGATDGADGKSGLVPAPKAGEEGYFLRGDGSWAQVAAAQTQIFEITLENEQSQENAIAEATKDAILASGDIAIVKKEIASGKHEYTAYVYDGAKWAAMDGNYSAENVYFESDLLTTSAVGVIELENGQATIPAAGKNLKEVFNTIFVKEENPETTEPSVTVSLPTAGAYEVGKTVKVSYTTTFEDGAYSYGPEPTGVIATSYSVSNGTDTVASATGNFDDVLVIDKLNYVLTATVGHTEGSVPVTNTGNAYAAGKIEAGTVTGTSSPITGYRSFFYGMSDVAKENFVLDSDTIRGLTNGGNYNARKTLKFTAANLANVKRFIIAIPADSTRSGLSSATITSSMNADATADYVEQTAQPSVKGAENYAGVPYKVWIYEPASIASTEVHSVVLG